MATSNPTLSQLKVRMARQLPQASSFAGTVYRSSTPQYATESDLLSGAGSKQHGGRWNPVGIAVVYASLTPETAMAETLAHYRYYGIPVEEAMPRTFVGIAVRLHAVLDLREGFVRRDLRVSLDRMLSADWRKEIAAGKEPITQLLGRSGSEIGLEGMIVPSVADSTGSNLLVFPVNIQTGGEVRVLASGRLNP